MTKMSKHNIDRLKKLLEEAKGERSIRQYALDAGVDPSTLSKTIQGKHNPSAKVLEKLTSVKANPRNGVTLTDLMIAAGYNVDNRIAENEMMDEDTAVTKDREREMIEYRQAQKQFEAIATGVIYGSLAAAGIRFLPIDVKGMDLRRFRPDLAVKLEDQRIGEWWFIVKKGRSGGSKVPSSAVESIFGKLVLIASDPRRKISITVDDEDLFNAFTFFTESNSYRGNLSVILVDTDTVSVRKEADISYYDPTDTDGIPKMTD